MTNTSTEQPEALQVSDALEAFNIQLFCTDAERAVVKTSIHMIRNLYARVLELESAESSLIAERDHRDEIIDRMADAVLGADRHEWTSAYDFVDAAQEVEDRMSVLIEMEKQAAFPIEGGSNG